MLFFFFKLNTFNYNSSQDAHRSVSSPSTTTSRPAPLNAHLSHRAQVNILDAEGEVPSFILNCTSQFPRVQAHRITGLKQGR